MKRPLLCLIMSLCLAIGWASDYRTAEYRQLQQRLCMTGELNYTGGAYGETEHYKFAFAFSGGLSEDDLAVAKFGISYLKSLLGD